MTGGASPALAAPCPATAARLSFRAFSGAEGLAGITAEWSRVLATLDRRRYTHFPAWYEAYARHLADPARLLFIVGYAGDAPVAVFPLASRAQRVAGVPVRALELATDGKLLNCEPVFAQGPATAGVVAAFVEYLRDGSPEPWDVLALRGLLEDSAAGASLRAVPPPRLVVEGTDPNAYLPCDGLAERLKRLPKSFRGTLRRARKALDAEAGVQFLRARTPAELAAAFPAFVAVEASGWKGARGSAIGSDGGRTEFYRAVGAAFAELGAAEINLLEIAGKPVAAQLGVKVDRRLYLLKIGYDEAYGRLAPGNLLFQHVLERCAAEREVDEVNLVSDAPWARRWRAEAHPRLTAYVFNGSPRGLASYWSLRAKQRARPVFRRMAAALRRAPDRDPGLADD